MLERRHMAEQKSTVQSIERAVDILEFLYRKREEASIREISGETGLSGGTVHRILGTLRQRGFVYQNESNSKYWLGLKFYSYGDVVKENLPIVSMVEPIADETAKKYKETVYMTVPSFESPVLAQQAHILKVSHSSFILRSSPGVGAVSPCHGSATGKCLMSYYPKALLEEYSRFPLPSLTSRSVTDWENMREELKKIRQKGYAVESEEEEVGLTCVAVPIVDKNEQIVAAVSLSGPTARIFSFPINEILADLRQMSREVTENF